MRFLLSLRAFPLFWSHSPIGDQDSFSHHPQIAQCKQRDELHCILYQATVASLAVSKLTLDHPKRMLASAFGDQFKSGVGKGGLFHLPITLESGLWMTYAVTFAENP